MPKIRLNGESVATELIEEIETCAKKYNKHPHDFSARFQVLPDIRGKKYGHFLLAEVTYEKGDLTKTIKQSES